MEKKKPVKKDKELIAKKDWIIVQNDIRIEIKKGDVVDVPEMFLVTLKTENVI